MSIFLREEFLVEIRLGGGARGGAVAIIMAVAVPGTVAVVNTSKATTVGVRSVRMDVQVCTNSGVPSLSASVHNPHTTAARESDNNCRPCKYGLCTGTCRSSPHTLGSQHKGLSSSHPPRTLDPRTTLECVLLYPSLLNIPIGIPPD